MNDPHQSRIVTTSWDDGNAADLCVGEILKSKHLRGTFYIPLRYHERTLTDAHLRELVREGFEIGAHTYSHKELNGLTTKNMADEIIPCKPSLEDASGSEVTMFCYPCGRYNPTVIRTLRHAGYTGARTTRMLATQLCFEPFEIPTTVQAFNHPSFTYFKNAAKARRLESLRNFVSQRYRLASWVELSKRLFDNVLQNGGIWHLYGHSWEIERIGLWDELREVMDYVSGRDGVEYLSNGQLASLHKSVSQ